MPLPYRRLPWCKRMSGRSDEVYGPADRFNTLEHYRHCLQALCFLPRHPSRAGSVVSRPSQGASLYTVPLRTVVLRGMMTGSDDLHVTLQHLLRAHLRLSPGKRLRNCSHCRAKHLLVHLQKFGIRAHPRDDMVAKMIPHPPHPDQTEAFPSADTALATPNSALCFDMDRVIKASQAILTLAVIAPKELVHAQCP